MHTRSTLTFSTLLVLLMVFAMAPASAWAQRERPQPRKVKEQIWYGGSFGLGFVGNQNFSQFNIGVFPMVGYKIVPWFSVGPRLGLDYNYYKAPSSLNNRNVSTNVFGFYGGAFARARIYRGIFAQTEYGVDLGAYPEVDLFGRLNVDANNKVIKRRITQEQGLIGLGYSSGGLVATEILVLYNVLLPETSYLNPWSYRIGFTYNF